MVRSKKVIIKNTTIPGLKKSWTLHRDQLGVFLAGDDDVVVTRKPLEKEFLAYLQDTGLISNNIHFVHPLEGEDDLKFDTLFRSPSIRETLRPLAHTHTLLTFYLTRYETDFSGQTGVPLYGNPYPGMLYNDKGHFRRLLKELNIPMPFGLEFVSRIELIDALGRLFRKEHGRNIETAVVKSADGSGGLRQFLVSKSVFINFASEELEAFISDRLSGWPQKEDSMFVVEEWLPTISYSPSIFFECIAGGKVNQVFFHNQLLDGPERRYNGCVSHITSLNNAHDRSGLHALHIAEYIASCGYEGFVGFDTVVNGEETFFVDGNFRMVSGYIPLRVSKKVSPSGLPLYYNSNISVPLTHVRSPNELLKFLRPLLYRYNSRQEGAIIIGTFPYFDSGKWKRYVDYFYFTPSYDELFAGLQRFRDILYSL